MCACVRACVTSFNIEPRERKTSENRESESEQERTKPKAADDEIKLCVGVSESGKVCNKSIISDRLSATRAHVTQEV